MRKLCHQNSCFILQNAIGNIVVRDADFEGVNPNALNVRGYRFLDLKVYFIYK